MEIKYLFEHMQCECELGSKFMNQFNKYNLDEFEWISNYAYIPTYI